MTTQWSKGGPRSAQYTRRVLGALCDVAVRYRIAQRPYYWLRSTSSHIALCQYLGIEMSAVALLW